MAKKRGIVMLVEDSTAFLKRQDQLEREGFFVMRYSDGEKAINDIERGIIYDIILVDNSLGEYDNLWRTFHGEDVVRASKKANPRTPILTISMFPYNIPGSNGYVKKDSTAKDLVGIIERYI